MADSEFVGYNHDPAGNRTALTYPGGESLSYTPTPLDQVDTVTLNGSPLVDYAYHGGGHRLASRTVTTDATSPTSYVTSIDYDSHRRTDAIGNTLDTGGTPETLAAFGYTHDLNGNPLTRSADGLTEFAADDRVFGLDSLDRLTGTQYAETDTDEQTLFDLVGNRERHTDRAGETLDFALANPANEYATIGGVAVTYDAAGNLARDEDGRYYDYDEQNRLTEIRADNGTTVLARYRYDALGRRITFEDPVAGRVVRYYYDGSRVIEERDAGDARLRYHVNGAQYIDERVATYAEAPAGAARELGATADEQSGDTILIS